MMPWNMCMEKGWMLSSPCISDKETLRSIESSLLAPAVLPSSGSAMKCAVFRRRFQALLIPPTFNSPMPRSRAPFIDRLII